MSMRDAESYPFTAVDPALGEASLQPYVPVTLTHQGPSITESALLDTGSAVNVLPHHVGVDLGADWERQTTPLRLTGNLAQFEARALLLWATIGQFEPVRMVFAWTQAPNVPLLLGQVNFFMEFDVCFYRSRLFLEIRPKA
jgi:hypothetical protein